MELVGGPREWAIVTNESRVLGEVGSNHIHVVHNLRQILIIQGVARGSTPRSEGDLRGALSVNDEMNPPLRHIVSRWGKQKRDYHRQESARPADEPIDFVRGPVVNPLAEIPASSHARPEPARPILRPDVKRKRFISRWRKPLAMDADQFARVLSHEAGSVLDDNRVLDTIDNSIANSANIQQDTIVSGGAELSHHGGPMDGDILEARAVSVFTGEVEIEVTIGRGDDDDDEFHSIAPATPSPWSIDSRDL